MRLTNTYFYSQMSVGMEFAALSVHILTNVSYFTIGVKNEASQLCEQRNLFYTWLIDLCQSNYVWYIIPTNY